MTKFSRQERSTKPTKVYHFLKIFYNLIMKMNTSYFPLYLCIFSSLGAHKRNLCGANLFLKGKNSLLIWSTGIQEKLCSNIIMVNYLISLNFLNTCLRKYCKN